MAVSAKKKSYGIHLGGQSGRPLPANSQCTTADQVALADSLGATEQRG
jgi:hypothetical protein